PTRGARGSASPSTYTSSTPRDARSCRSSDASHVHLGPAVRPRPRLLELRRDADEQVLTPVGGGELDADRKSVAVPEKRQRDRRLTRDVERRGERHEGQSAPEAAQGIAGTRGGLAERRRRL